MLESWRTLLAVWMAMLGGCVGSFLNVVIYRVPRGMSLVYPGSHCPGCGHPIRWYHNLPVLGWIAIGGRCHDCHTAIPVRYPLVEAITAAMFVAVAWQGVLAAPGISSAVLSTGPFSGTVTGWWWCGYRLVLLCGLLVLALVEWGGRPNSAARFPWSLVVGPAAAGLLIPLVVWTWRTATGAAATPDESARPFLVEWTFIVVGGAAAAALFAMACWPATATGPAGDWGRWFTPGSLLLVGVFLSGPAVFVLAPASSLCHLAATCAARWAAAPRRPPWSAWLFALTWVWIAAGGTALARQSPWPVWAAAPVVAGLLLATGLVSLGTSVVDRQPPAAS